MFGGPRKREEEAGAIPPSVKAKAELAKTLVGTSIHDRIDYAETRKQRKEEFDRKIESLCISEEEKEAYRREFQRYENAYLRLMRQKISLSDFEMLSLLGRGAFGKVYLTRKKDTKEVLALKQLSKKTVNTTKKLTRLMVERDVLMNKKDSPWLVRLYYSFQDEKNLYLAMEYVPGGDMWALLSKVGSLKEEYARFYAAEMINAVASLHKLGYIHRDLKPDNFLIDRTGHLKLTDFGLSKAGVKANFRSSLRIINNEAPVNNSSATFAERRKSYRAREKMAFSFVGTLSYMAIEILAQEGYSNSVDWWSIGCILFEMLAGMPPFYAESDEQIVMNVWQFKKTLIRPLSEDGEFVIGDAAWDLICGLIKTPNKRIGRNGVDEIQGHRFFQSIDWNNLRDSEKNSPPFVPNLSSDADTAYFSGDASAMTPSIEAFLNNAYHDESPMLEDKNFASFSFRRMSTLEPGVNVKLSNLGGCDSNPGSLHLEAGNSDESLVKEVAEEPGVEGATFIVKRVAKTPYRRKIAVRAREDNPNIPSPTLPPVSSRDETLPPPLLFTEWFFQMIMWAFPFGWAMPQLWTYPST